MSVFDPHNVETCRAIFNGDEVEAVDEMDYRTLLLLYEDAIKTVAIYKSAFEDVMYQEFSSNADRIADFLGAARVEVEMFHKTHGRMPE
jgi:hypothetical protein